MVTYKGTPVRLAHMSAETLQARREWNDILKILKNKNWSTRNTLSCSYNSDMKEK